MISSFIREQKTYSKNDLCLLLSCSYTELNQYIKILKQNGVLKQIRKEKQQDIDSIYNDIDVEYFDSSVEDVESLFVFTFVGIIIIHGRVLKCYPKYLQHSKNPLKEFKQVLRLLEKYHSKNQYIGSSLDVSEIQSSNFISKLLFLLDDYYSNGIYSSSKEIVDINGSGEILWDKTINESSIFFNIKRPFYFDLKTKKKINNDQDFFKRLHECILTRISAELKEADLLDLFNLTELNLTDEKLENFGDTSYILYCIEGELNLQFNTRKQNVLKGIYEYIENLDYHSPLESFSLYGTNCFYKVWEDVCSEIMDNQLKEMLGRISLPTQLSEKYKASDRLIDIIEKPLWTATGHTAADTLIPDLVSIKDSSFIIIDAKYYNAVLNEGKTPTNQPGIDSITKQYFYQLAFQDFIQDHEFTTIKNCFIFPTEKDEIILKGEVFMGISSRVGLEPIKVRFLPASNVFDLYLSDKKFDIDMLGLD